MTYDNGVVTCKSRSPFFEREYRGDKSNTERIVPVDELVDLARCEEIQIVHAKDDSRGFFRTITDMTDITDVLLESLGEKPKPLATGAKRVVVISWEHPDA